MTEFNDGSADVGSDAVRRDRAFLLGGLAATGALVVGIMIGLSMRSEPPRSSPSSLPSTVYSTITSTVSVPPALSVVSPPPINSQPTQAPVPMSYSGMNRVFAVGDGPRGGLTASIPPGRYSVTIADGASGSWMRCSSELCSLAYTENVIAIENAFGPNYQAVMEIEPTDVAVALLGVTLTPVG